MTTIAQGGSAVLAVVAGDSITLNSGKSDVARLTITTGDGAGSVVTASHSGRKKYGPFAEGTVTLQAVSGYCTYYVSSDGASDDLRTATVVRLDETDLSGLHTAGRPVAAGVLVASPATGVIYGQSDGAGGYEAFGGGGGGASASTAAPIVGRRISNVSGSTASYILARPGARRYGGVLVVSGTFNLTVRHGTVVGGDILQYMASAAGDLRIKPVPITDGLYLTLSANAEVVVFFSDTADSPYTDVDVGGPVVVPMTATGRFWLGRGLLRGFTVTGQTTAGTGIKIYDGWDNVGAAVYINAAPVVGRMGGAAEFIEPIELRSGGYVELLGTGQTVSFDMGAA